MWGGARRPYCPAIRSKIYDPWRPRRALILGWKTKVAKAAFEGGSPKGFAAELLPAARRRLAQLNAARTVEDMKGPPGNRLHALTSGRKGHWSISVNDRFRICFIWTDNEPGQIEFVDYR